MKQQSYESRRFKICHTLDPFALRAPDGVFKVAYAIRRTLPPYAPYATELAEQLAWFEANMAVPTRFSTSRHPRATGTAICWVKANALEHVRRLRSLVALIEAAGHVRTDELRTERPGYIVFEDGHQVVALPFANTPR